MIASSFIFFVKPETFAGCAAKVSVDEMILSVGSVAGFYSEWSPSISTRTVKVLTKGSEQKITFPPGNQVEPPRLGHVGAAELYMNRRLDFGNRAREPETLEEPEFLPGVQSGQSPRRTGTAMLCQERSFVDVVGRPVLDESLQIGRRQKAQTTG